MPKFNEFLFGTKDKIKQKSTLTPEQQQLMELIQQGLETGEGPFGDLFGQFDEDAFNKGVRDPALKSFQEDILPQVQEKFIAGNQVLGSGMRRGQLKAATDLQDKLAQLMYQAQQKQQENRLQGVNTLLGTRGVENIYKQGRSGVAAPFVEGAGKAAASAAANAAMSAAGAPPIAG